MTNKERFTEALTKAYQDLFSTNPEYSYSVAHTTPEALALKMTEGLITGAANKDGEGIKTACRQCGIKQTYKAIQSFLSQ